MALADNHVQPESELEMKTMIRRFMDNRCGATAIEYALIASLISIALIGGASTLGNAINTSMNDVSQHLKNSQ